jgi:hypothetical protein
MNFATLTTLASATHNLFYDGMAVGTTDADRGKGKWAIRFFDSNGEDWLTESMDAGTSCDNVIKALEALPNNVIPVGTTKCSTLAPHEKLNGDLAGFTLKEEDYQVAGKERNMTAKIAFWEGVADQKDTATVASSTVGLPNSYDSTATNVIPMSGYIYRIKFFGNPGALKQPEIETMLDGDRSSLMATDFSLSSTTARTITSVWTDGQQGEDNDYIADHCNGVQFTVAKFDNTAATDATLPSRMIHYLKSLTTAELALLKTCLGSSDNTQANNVESYDWDYGTYEFPHLVKIVRSQTTYTDGGHYAALIWRQSRNTVGSDGYATSASTTDSNFFQSGWFELINPWYPLDADVSNIYEMYTTKGTLKLTAEKANAYFGFGSKTIFTYNTADANKEVSNAAAAGAGADTYNSYSGSVACEVNNKCDSETAAGCTTATKYRSKKTGHADDQTNFEKNSINECLEKGHMFTFLSLYDDSADLTALGKKVGYNPSAINLYTATRLRTADASATWKDVHGVAADLTDATAARQAEQTEQKSQMWRHQINTDLSVNWASAPASGIDATTGDFRLYKFTPADASTYNYVGECSNRGLCDSSEALCECFPGYSGDNCAQQNSLAV